MSKRFGAKQFSGGIGLILLSCILLGLPDGSAFGMDATPKKSASQKTAQVKRAAKKKSAKKRKTAAANRHEDSNARRVDHHMPPPGGGGEEENHDFYRKRALPYDEIDPENYMRALEQARKMPVLGHGMSKNGTLATFTWKQVGPFNIGGRISAIATHPTDSNIFYVGAACGGLWKTADHGKSWQSLTDTFAMLPIGAVALDPSNAQTIYLGQGESNSSGDSYPGYGLWKSVNDGHSWSYMGLGKTQYISKILFDPNNSNTLYLSAPGPNSLTDSNRGLFKSVDGGQNWTKVLSVRTTGSKYVPIIDFAINPLNGSELVAASWDKSNGFEGSSGPASGLWHSTDAGAHWKRIDTLNTNLPNGVKLKFMGRSCVMWVNDGGSAKLYAAFSITDTNAVTKLQYDQNFYGLYSATDPEGQWTQLQDKSLKIPYSGQLGPDSVNPLFRQGGYNFYLAQNPRNAKEIYLGGIDVQRSTDGGKSFFDITNAYIKYFQNDRTQHSDQHGLAFSAAANDLLVVSDGGVFSTKNYGQTWEQLKGLPITMFYSVEPWRGALAHFGESVPIDSVKIFGGTQDNGSVAHGFTDTTDWNWINRGDGGVAISHPTDAQKIYTSIQLGRIYLKTSLDSLYPNLSYDPNGIKPTSPSTVWREVSHSLLFGPNRATDTNECAAFIAPVALDERSPNEIYTARLHIYRGVVDYSNPLNTRWYRWSPQIGGYSADSTSWAYGNLDCIGIGPRDASGRPMLWGGGFAYTTNSIGATIDNLWRTHVEPGLGPNDPPTWIKAHGGLPSVDVTSIVPDRSDSMLAYATTSSYGNGHVYMTSNGGKTWKNIGTGLPDAPASALVIDSIAEHGNPALKNKCLIVANDVGVYVTTNGGTSWSLLGEGMPKLVVGDLKQYKNLLIAGTHGRSAWAMDISGLSIPFDAVAEHAATANAPQVLVNPNPLHAGASTITVTLRNVKQSGQQAQLQLIEVETGKIILTEKITGSKASLRIPEGISAGAYFISLTVDGTQVASRSVSVLR